MYKIAVLNYIELHWNMNYIAVSLKLIQHCKLTIHQLKKEKSSLQVQVAQSHPAESVQLFSRIQLFVAPRTAARQTSLSITNSQSLLKLMSMESVVPSNHLILCHPLHLLPSIFPRTLCSPCRCCSTPGCCCLHSFMSSYLHKFFGKYMLNTLVSWSRKDQSPWLLKTDLSVFLCLFPWLYLLPHLDLQVKPRKPTKNKCFVVYLRIIQKILLLFLVKKINFLKSVLYSLFQPKCEFFFF